MLLGAFWIAGMYFDAGQRFGGHLLSAFVSFAFLLAPYWAFGFGLARSLPRLKSLPHLLLAAYVVYAVPRGSFSWTVLLGLAVFIVAVTSLAALRRTWADWTMLLILALSVETHVFDSAWPLLSKLLVVDVALYSFLVIRELEGVGFDFRVRSDDFRIGLREFAFFTPIAVALGFALQFLHFHATLANPVWFGSAWIFTLFFIAVPEELFFRGLMLNMLERSIGPRKALVVTSIVFGLAHFNKRAAFFNWRYVLLAAIAGVFYARAWLADRRVLTSSITHATVDTVWSIWLR